MEDTNIAKTSPCWHRSRLVLVLFHRILSDTATIGFFYASANAYTATSSATATAAAAAATAAAAADADEDDDDHDTAAAAAAVATIDSVSTAVGEEFTTFRLITSLSVID